MTLNCCLDADSHTILSSIRGNGMRLSQFILSNLESILAEWESFARGVLPESGFEKLALRDEAEAMLKTIAHDMETSQTATEQAEKAKGRGLRTEQDSAAEIHAGDRLRVGFNQVQVLSEYRALRASVIRLWINSSPEIDNSALDQLIRFNEGIDQALSESTARSMQEIEKSRDFAVAVLAHDLRNPLQAILSSAQLLQTEEEPDKALINTLTSTILNSGMRMSKLIENLRDFTRTRLGQPLPVTRKSMDLAPVFRQTRCRIRGSLPRAHHPFRLRPSSSRSLACRSFKPDAFESDFQCNRARRPNHSCDH
jgi:signal transduction histidine kinase